MSANIQIALTEIQRIKKIYNGLADIEDLLKTMQGLDQNQKELRNGVAKANKEFQEATEERDKENKALVTDKAYRKKYLQETEDKANKILSDAEASIAEQQRLLKEERSAVQKEKLAIQKKTSAITADFVEAGKQLDERNKDIARVEALLNSLKSTVKS